MKTRYKFLKKGFKSANGDCVWKTNVWKKHKGELNLCQSGFHDALTQICYGCLKIRSNILREEKE